MELIILAITTLLSIIWSIIFVLPALFGYQLRKIDGLRLNTLQSKVSFSSLYVDDTPEGWCFGKWFICYIITESTEKSQKKYAYVICNPTYYNQTICKKDTTKVSKTITFLYKTEPYWWSKYVQLPFEPKQYTIRNNQRTTIDDILNVYEKTSKVVCYLYGETRTGKSSIPKILASKMKETCETVYYTDTFKPTDPNDSFFVLHTTVNPNKESPLIVVLEEVDGIIRNAHEKTVPRHNHLPISITDKSSWNTFLDRFDDNMFKNVILIMTSNEPISNINKLDPSYLGENRVNITREIKREY